MMIQVTFKVDVKGNRNAVKGTARWESGNTFVSQCDWASIVWMLLQVPSVLTPSPVGLHGSWGEVPGFESQLRPLLVLRLSYSYSLHLSFLI